MGAMGANLVSSWITCNERRRLFNSARQLAIGPAFSRHSGMNTAQPLRESLEGFEMCVSPSAAGL